MLTRDKDLERDDSGHIILSFNYSDLFKKRNYLAPVEYLIDRITEYDIKHANISVMRRYSNIISNAALDKLDALGPDRNKEFGKLMMPGRPNAEKIKTDLASGIILAKKELFSSNLLQDSDILSIKNDAVFVIGRKLKNRKFGSVEFAEKNYYSAYIHLGKYEFYYNSTTEEIDVKGLSDEIIREPDHQNGMVIFLKTIFRFLITDNKTGLRNYLRKFSHDYKSLSLPYYYYRELNPDNCYRSKYNIAGFQFDYTQANDSIKSELIITFNYKFYILPIIQQHYW